MRFSGIVRKVDEQGRISVPTELRDMVGLNEGEPFEIFTDDDSGRLIIRRYQPFQCIFCGSMEGLLFFQKRFVCDSCLTDFSVDQEIAVATENETIVKPDFLVRGRKPKTSWEELLSLMEAYPNEKQKDWAKRLGVSQGRISQMIKKYR